MKIKNILAITALLGLGISAQAVPITGGLSFAGSYTPNNANLFTATSIAFGNTFVTSGNGSFAGFAPGSTVTMTPSIVINPTVVPVIALWAIGGYSFDALSLIQSDQTAATLTLTGTGLIKNGNPADQVNGLWIATFNTVNNTFSWSASAGAVPDGGTTVAMLGSVLAGLGLIRRKLSV